MFNIFFSLEAEILQFKPVFSPFHKNERKKTGFMKGFLNAHEKGFCVFCPMSARRQAPSFLSSENDL